MRKYCIFKETGLLVFRRGYEQRISVKSKGYLVPIALRS